MDAFELRLNPDLTFTKDGIDPSLILEQDVAKASLAVSQFISDNNLAPVSKSYLDDKNSKIVAVFKNQEDLDKCVEYLKSKNVNMDKVELKLNSDLNPIKEGEGTEPTTATNAPAVEKTVQTLGDLTSDGNVTSEDATYVLIEFAKALLDGKKSADNLLEYGDINKDGKVTSEDATCILIWYASYMLDKKTPTIDKFKF